MPGPYLNLRSYSLVQHSKQKTGHQIGQILSQVIDSGDFVK